MKNIYIIDDSKFKQERISEYMKSIFPDAQIHIYSYINAGLREIHKNLNEIKELPDDNLFIVDMCIPQLMDTMPKKDGGMRILRELNRMKITSPVIIATSEEFEEKEHIKDNYHNINLLGVVIENASVYTLPAYKELLNRYIK